MTPEEFSDQFDVLVNTYLATAETDPRTNIVFDEYEKSVFLTQALEDSVVSLYNGKNPFGDSFESKEEIREYLKKLTETYHYEPEAESNDELNKDKHINKDTIFVPIPEDVWYITYESVDLSDDNLPCGNDILGVEVTPVTQDAFSKTRKNPFRSSNTRRVLRLDSNSNEVELYSKYNVAKYTLKYIRRPKPIILPNVELDGNVTINGQNESVDCELHEALHRPLLKLAVRMALASRGIGNASA